MKARAELAKTALAQALKSRQDAANAQAPKLSPDLWEDAQDKFGDAIRYLEGGNGGLVGFELAGDVRWSVGQIRGPRKLPVRILS